MKHSWIYVFGLIVSAEFLTAATVEFTQDSINDSTSLPNSAISRTDYLNTPSEQITETAPGFFEQQAFVFWSNDSYPVEPYRDFWGRSLNPISFTLLEDTIATAHYLSVSENLDADSIPDWFEMEYYGDLDEGDSSDTDGDSIILRDEYNEGTHPLFANSHSDGGIFRNESALITVNLAGYSQYTLTSQPLGKVNISEIVEPGTTVTATDFTNDNTFGYWLLDGARQDDAWGIAYPQIQFTVEESDRTAIAHFFDGSTESPADLIPDAYEYYYYGHTINNENSDTDGDGFTLLEEYQNGTLPHFANTSTDGGVEWADSALVTVNFADFSRYTLSSHPTGTIDETAVVPDGTTITTSEITASNFAYWTLDGVRQEDAWGVAQRTIEFLMNGADRNATAIFIDGDSDLDGVDDAFELYHYNTLANDGNSDSDGDGITLLNEFNNGTNPIFPNQLSLGGIFWDDSKLVVANLQPFERLSKALLDGVLTDLFSRNPGIVSGISTSGNSSTAAGDWDGDGDFDLFIAHNSGLRVFENVGTPSNPNFLEISGLADLSSLLEGLNEPTIVSGDWNRDGLDDLVIGGDGSILRLVTSTSNYNTTGSIETLDTGSSVSIPALGDFNNDDQDDLIVLLDDGSVRIYLNTGTAPPFDAYTENLLGQTIIGGISLAAGDINQDDRIDVLASDSDGRIWEFHQNQDGSFTLMSKVWGGSYAGFASGLKITAVDLEQDGDLDLVAGLANGSILGLRDPRAGRPTGLLAIPGADSILLEWNASWQSRIAGYSIYRSNLADGPFSSLLDEPYPLPNYRDTDLTPGSPYHYYLTSVSRFFLPGNSEPRIVESLPSDVVSANAGEVTLSIRSVRGQPNKKVKIPISIDNSLGLSAEGLSIQISYDDTVIIPLVQDDPTRDTVKSTALTKAITFTDNGTTANGNLTITGSAGEIRAGSGKLFVLEFKVLDSASLGLRTTINITAATLHAESGLPLTVHIESSAELEVANDFILGDVDGDGDLTDADEDLLKELTKKKSRPPTEAELLAGDLNGDGELNQQDVVLIKRLLRNLPIE